MLACKMLGSTQICTRNTKFRKSFDGKLQPNVQQSKDRDGELLWPHSGAEMYHGLFKKKKKKLVGQLEALLPMLVPYLRKQSTKPN